MTTSLNIDATEAIVILSALNIITLKGSDAKLVANLQYKVEAAQTQITKKIEAEEKKKEAGLKELVKR
jgi:hypothetical protein|tara:strand:+ start:400 stop:603 length:204 start_codon:yes stop_codon:yes gene_type:complete